MIWQGYCVDFAHRLSEKLDFDYVLVPAKTGGSGERIPGLNNTWDGLVHDLMTAVRNLGRLWIQSLIAGLPLCVD